MKKLLLAFFLLGFIQCTTFKKLINEKEEGLQEAEDFFTQNDFKTIQLLVGKKPTYSLDTLFQNDTMKVVVGTDRSPKKNENYFFCSKKGSEFSYIGKVNGFLDTKTAFVKVLTYNDGLLTFFARNDRTQYFRVLVAKNKVFQEKALLYCDLNYYSFEKSYLFAPLALDIADCGKDKSFIRYWIDVESGVSRRDMEYYVTEDFPLVNGKIALEIK